MSSKIVYTSIFGGYDDVQKQNLPDGWDYCQTPQTPAYLLLVGLISVENEIINQTNC